MNINTYLEAGGPIKCFDVYFYRFQFCFILKRGHVLIGVPEGGLGGAEICFSPPDSGRNLEKFGQLSRKIRAQKDEENPQILPQILP